MHVITRQDSKVNIQNLQLQEDSSLLFEPKLTEKPERRLISIGDIFRLNFAADVRELSVMPNAAGGVAWVKQRMRAE